MGHAIEWAITVKAQQFPPGLIFFTHDAKNTLFTPNQFDSVEPSHQFLMLHSHTFFHAHLHHRSIMAACIVIPLSLYDMIQHDNQCNLMTTKQ
jgi:hypothetical protein